MTTLTAEERNEIHRQIHEALEAHLAPDTKAIAFIIVSTRAGETMPVGGYVAMGRSAPGIIMAAATTELFELGEILGVRPHVIASAINSASERLLADEADTIPATEVPQ